MPRIEKLLAYVMADKDENDEGVPAILVPSTEGADLIMYPLMGADEERLISYRQHAQNIATARGKPIKLLRFTCLEVVEVIEPKDRTEAEYVRYGTS